MRRAAGVGLSVLALLACSPEAPARNALTDPGAQTGLAEVPLTIRSGTKEHRFTVEVAATDAEQQKGLMFRRSLAPDRGMIFPYEPAQPLAFWMKNTLIALDLIFIRADGRISSISKGEPLSLEPIPSTEPVVAVLEIAGGRSAELGIKAGDQVSWRR